MELFITLLIFLILIVGIIKKIDLRCLMILECILMLIFLTVTRGSVMGDNSSGNCILDIVYYMANAISSNIGGIMLSNIICFAYVEVMAEIKASDMLAYYLKKPMKMLRNPYIMVGFVVIIGGFLRTCISIAPPASALMIGSFLPALIAVGCPYETACVSMLIFSLCCWGPADPSCLAASQIMGIEVNLADWFVTIELPMACLCLLILAVVYPVTNYLMDKKGCTVKEVKGDINQKPDCPGLYAVLPLLPLIFMLLFSPFVFAGISIDINTACVLSMVCAVVVVLAFTLSTGKIFDIMNTFFNSLGNNLKNLGMVIIFALTFASLMNEIGGMTIIAEWLSGLSVPPVILVLLISLFSAGINAILGSFFGSIAIALPLAASAATASGVSPAALCFLVIMACSVGCLSSPINPIVLTVAEKCDISIGKLIKRMAPAIWTAIIIVSVFTTFYFRV